MPDRDRELLPLIREAEAARDDYQERTRLAVAAVMQERPSLTSSDALAIVRRLRAEMGRETDR